MFSPSCSFAACILILTALVLGACSTPDERQLQKIADGSEALWAEYEACMTRVAGTDAYQRLEQAFILSQYDPHSIEKMAIARHASSQEKADLLENKKNTLQCQQELFKGFADINPSFNTLLARFMAEDDELILQTLQDDITIGERNVIVERRYAERLKEWVIAGERVVELYAWYPPPDECTVYCSTFLDGKKRVRKICRIRKPSHSCLRRSGLI